MLYFFSLLKINIDYTYWKLTIFSVQFYKFWHVYTIV